MQMLIHIFSILETFYFIQRIELDSECDIKRKEKNPILGPEKTCTYLKTLIHNPPKILTFLSGPEISTGLETTRLQNPFV